MGSGSWVDVIRVSLNIMSLGGAHTLEKFEVNETWMLFLYNEFSAVSCPRERLFALNGD